MTPIRFVKAQANGNDFLIVEAAAVAPEERSRLAQQLCDRHLGVGADGVEFVAVDSGALDLASEPLRLQLFNADGGEAEISGNGTRCVTAFYARRGFRAGVLETGAGPVRARVVEGEGETWWIELELGTPRIDGLEADTRLSVLERELPVTILSMGNPQCLVRVSDFPGDWQALGAAIETHPRFPHRTNVAFLRVVDRHHLEIRIFERGVGPTHSSGTGSSAAAVAAIANGWCDSPVEVSTVGGVQSVDWQGAAVKLVGPAQIVAEGQYYRR